MPCDSYVQNLREHQTNLEDKEQRRAAFHPFLIQNELGVGVQYRTEERGKAGVRIPSSLCYVVSISALKFRLAMAIARTGRGAAAKLCRRNLW